MGKLALAAKITHVPSMYLSELPGKNHGCRQGAIDGHKEISKRCREMGVDTIIVFDTHWLVNSAYHINCADHFEGIYTSNELPHFIRDMTYNYEGNPELGQLIADEALKLGVRAKAHNIPSLKLEYGTLVPMRYMNEDKHFKVVSISAFCTVHDFADSRKLGEAILKAIEQYDGTVAVLASGSLSHRFIDDQRAEEGMNSYTREFDRQMDERVVKLWREGQFKEFCNMLPEYADYCYGEGNMHDTVMLLGMLGWDQHIFGLMDRQARVRGFHRGDLRHVLVDQIAQTAHQARALFHRQIGPFRERLFRCRYRLIDLRFTAGGHIRQHFTRCRIGSLEVVVTCNIFTVDPMIYFFHFAVSSLTIRFTRRPTPSTSTTTSSPGTTSDKPFGVPVAIMSPGFRVINSLK